MSAPRPDRSRHRAQHRARHRWQPRRVLAALSLGAVTAGGVAAAPPLLALVSVSTAASDVSPHAPGPLPRSYAEAFIEVAGEETPEVDVDAAVAVARQKATEPLPNLARMTLPELQRYAAQMQAEFVQATLAFEAAQTEAEQAAEAAEQAHAESVQARVKAARVRDDYASQVVATYASGVLDDPVVKAVFSGSESMSDYIETYQAVQVATTAAAVSVEQVQEASVEAEVAAEEATEARRDAVAARTDAQTLLDDIQGRAARVAAAANEALASSAQGTMFASAEQRARNRAALQNWRAYLARLDAARVVPPAAAALARPARLPRGLRPLVGGDGRPVSGVAAVKHRGATLTVLPRETIAAVSRVFAAVGRPYVAGASGPDTYDCAGLVAAAFTGPHRVAGAEPVRQYATTRLVNPDNAQVGDLVFFTAKDAGVQHVGLNLGGGLMLTSDAISNQVGVQEFPKRVFAVGRATLPRPASPQPTTATADSPWRCGGAPAAGNSMVYPVAEGSFRFTSTFGETGSLWSSGYHTGLDFAAPAGTAVVAAKSGVVTVEAASWAGPNYVSIEHGDGLSTAYAHMQSSVVKTGDVVQAGQLIGTVGSLGNSTGPHLHFEVLLNGVQVDPMLFLDPGSTGTGSGTVGGWGGFSNGMIPTANLCAVSATSTHRLRCDAAAAYRALAAAYQRKFGSPLCLTDSYRSYDAQVTLYGQKPTLAAVPGTSNHGWALAVDLCGGVERFGTPQHAWMQQNGPRFGWVHPQWARQGGSREEPWHWEFGNLS